MKRLLSVLILVFGLAACSKSPPTVTFMAPAASTQVDPLFHPANEAAAVTARVENPDGSRGSAVQVGPRHLVTAAHVVVLLNRVIEKETAVVFSDGSRTIARIVAIDVNIDLALLELDKDRAPHAVVLDTAPVAHEIAIATGYPFGQPDATINEGRIIALDQSERLRTSTPLVPGMSGGGIFVIRNGHVALVSIGQQSYPDYTVVSRGVRYGDLVKFLKR